MAQVKHGGYPVTGGFTAYAAPHVSTMDVELEPLCVKRTHVHISISISKPACFWGTKPQMLKQRVRNAQRAQSHKQCHGSAIEERTTSPPADLYVHRSLAGGTHTPGVTVESEALLATAPYTLTVTTVVPEALE